MVTLQGDNRYYGRSYRRSNYESRIAEEYEVREMLERARRLYLGIEEELARRGCSDPYSSNFGGNPYTRRLATRTASPGSDPRRVPAEMWVGVVVLPTGSGDIQSQDRREWTSWLDPSTRWYQPDMGGLFVPYLVGPTFGGVACVAPHYLEGAVADLQEYLLVGFDGAVELGFCPATTRDESQHIFWGGQLVRRIWQTLNFVADVRSRLGTLAPHLLAVNIRNTEGAILAGFARGWTGRDPTVSGWVDFEDAPKCLEPNIQIRREFTAQDFEEVARADANPSQQVRDLADDVCSALGLRIRFY